MAKLFVERLEILETKLDELKKEEPIDERINKLEKQIEELNSKINQIVNEITPIITSHANALNALLGKRT